MNSVMDCRNAFSALSMTSRIPLCREVLMLFSSVIPDAGYQVRVSGFFSPAGYLIDKVAESHFNIVFISV